MDIGEGAHTQFTTERMMADYMAQKPELLDCYNGLVHSHHRMTAFFSGEDSSTLHQEGVNRNNFVSLVVDTRGTYVAAITRRVEIETTFTPHSTASYPFFSRKVVPVAVASEPAEIRKTQYAVQCFPMNVIRHEVNCENEYIDRFADLLGPALVPTPVKSAYKGYQSFNDINTITNKHETPAHTPFQGIKALQEEVIRTPELPFPGVHKIEDAWKSKERAEETEETEETDNYSWELADQYKPLLSFKHEKLEDWLVTLFAGTQLKCITEHIKWSAEQADRMLNSWADTLILEEFERFMFSWVPYLFDCTDFTSFFDKDVLVHNPELEENDLVNIFFLHVREALYDVEINCQNMDLWIAVWEALEEEFDYQSVVKTNNDE